MTFHTYLISEFIPKQSLFKIIFGRNYKTIQTGVRILKIIIFEDTIRQHHLHFFVSDSGVLHFRNWDDPSVIATGTLKGTWHDYDKRLIPPDVAEKLCSLQQTLRDARCGIEKLTMAYVPL